MTDREMLESAAKAGGMEGMRYASPYTGMSKMLDPARPETTGSIGPNWNPLTDDGDALRLAVRCAQLSGFYRLLRAWLIAMTTEQGSPSDPNAVTRRAIVLAAAEIGRQMK